MEVLIVAPVVAVPAQTVKVVMVMSTSMTRSQTVTIVKNRTVRQFHAGIVEVKEAAGNAIQPEKKRRRRPRETGTAIALGTGMVIRRRRENAREIKIVEKETAIENVNGSGIATVTGIGIDIAGMIKIATGMSEKSGS